jgi:hypothetical protein
MKTKSWRLFFPLNTSDDTIAKVFKKYKLAGIKTSASRMIQRNGLFVHADPEICYVVYGPENLDRLLSKEKSVSFVGASPGVSTA